MRTVSENLVRAPKAHDAASPGHAPERRPWPSARLELEWKTLAAMIRCYCRAQHRTVGGLCEECRGLLDYATIRLERCQFGESKPTCATCPVHCYQRERREQVKRVMRYAGPRMLWEHPVLSLRHWWDGVQHRAPARRP
jgi:Nitrous oxide-stimulated promoter